MKPTIEEVRGLPDGLRLYQWILSIPKAQALMGVGSRALNTQCLSSTVPKRTNEKITKNIRGHKIHMPGQFTYDGQITLTFHETTSVRILRAVEQWCNLITEPITGSSRPKRLIETPINLILLDGNNIPIYMFKLMGCWLEDYDFGGELSGEQNETAMPQMIISYDYFIPTNFGINLGI